MLPASTCRGLRMPGAGSPRARLESQSVVGVGDRTLADIQFGLRFSPALCTTGVAIATALASWPLVLVMMATAVLGAVTPRHPFDWVYNYGVRHLLDKPPIPRNAAPRRFSCAVGAVWLAITAGSFFLGWNVVGYILGAGMTGMAAFVAVTHICLPSLVYIRLFDRVGDVPEISVEEAHRRLRDGALGVDVRDGEFWDAGHVPGATHIPSSDLATAVAGFDPERPVLVVCQGGVMSLKGAKVLRDAGLGAACSVRGGMTSWLKHGLPVERTP